MSLKAFCHRLDNIKHIDPINRKTPLIYLVKEVYENKVPQQKYSFCQGRIKQTLSAVPP